MGVHTLWPVRRHAAKGMEVADVMMIEDQEVIFFTQGGDYVVPTLMDGGGGDDSASSSDLPAVVGAYKVCASTENLLLRCALGVRACSRGGGWWGSTGLEGHTILFP